MSQVYASVKDLPAHFSTRKLEPLPQPNSVLLCPPDFFEVIDVKNPFMADHIGQVDREKAKEQWETLKDTFESLGLGVYTLPPVEQCEDMVFCANQTLVGTNRENQKICVVSHMRFPSRQKEVPAVAAWFQQRGYQVTDLARGFFEGSGDAIWMPDYRLLWGGVGPRTEHSVYPLLSERFQTPVATLELATETFYHLDTCFCPLNAETVLIYPPAFSKTGLELIHRVFDYVIEASREEACDFLVCNAAVFFNKHIVIQAGSLTLNRKLEQRGFQVHPVDTSEFLKSGGSVYCIKMAFTD